MMVRKWGRWVIAGLALLVVAAGPLAAQEMPQAALRKVKVQLKWFHQFQFAGYYAALEQGYFREAGLDVQLLEGKPDVDPVDVVVNGDAHFGVGNSGLVIKRGHGLPVVALAAIFQHSPFVLLARRSPDIRSIHDLMGRAVMFESHAAELIAYLALEKVSLESLKIVPHTGDPSLLASGRIDALTSYTTTEPYLLDKQGIPFQVFNPRASGIDFYGDTLFTTDAVLHSDPVLVQRFRLAVLRGWRYAMDHPDEMIDLIMTRYQTSSERAKLEFEAAEIRRLMLPDVVEIGYMHRGRWRHIADGFASAGLLPVDYSLDGFLYEPDIEPDMGWLYGSLAGALFVILLVSAVLLRFHSLNRDLHKEVAERRRLEDELRALAATDSLTGVNNRRRFDQLAEQEVQRAVRFGNPLAMLMCDIDHFKRINDTFGHAVGDRALRATADAFIRVIREFDVLGRVGGEEFAVILPQANPGLALEVAERLREAVAAVSIKADDGRAVNLTTSIGVASLTDAERSLDSLYSRADAALYRAKNEGQNRVCVAATVDA